MTEENPARALASKFSLAVTVGGVTGLGILRGPGEIADAAENSDAKNSDFIASLPKVSL